MLIYNLGGFIFGGGLSYMFVQYGWFVSLVYEFEVVFVDGIIVVVFEDENMDFFYFLKGGGNNFVIVIFYIL